MYLSLLCLLLLLLSRFSCVRFCATPETAAYQAPLSLGFSRQEQWNGLPFLLQCMRVKSESEITQSCPTLSDPMDYSPPGSSIHGIFQARVLELCAIAFSNLYLNVVFFKQFPSINLTYVFICPLIDGSIDIDRYFYIDAKVIIYAGNAMNKANFQNISQLDLAHLHYIKLLYCFETVFLLLPTSIL